MERKPKGLNFRESKGAQIIDMGVHIDQFIEYLQQARQYQNSSGWINFTIYRNANPDEKKGYSHQASLKTETKKCIPITIDEVYKQIRD